MELTDDYLQKVSRSVGVLPFWVDDCVQEIRIKLWQHPDTMFPRLMARTTAIDFVRKTSHYSRRERRSPVVECFTAIEAHSRLEGTSWLDTFEARRPPVEDVLDCREAVASLSPREKRLISGVALGDTMRAIGAREGISESRVCQLIKHARERLAS